VTERDGPALPAYLCPISFSACVVPVKQMARVTAAVVMHVSCLKFTLSAGAQELTELNHSARHALRS
jgi:hypothetical protein